MNSHRSGVLKCYLVVTWLVLHELLLSYPVYTIQPLPCTKTHYFSQSQICRVNAYLVVTCYLHLCATVVTGGWNGYSGFKTTTNIYMNFIHACINFFLFCAHCNLYCSCFLLILLSFFYTQKMYSSAPFLCLVNCIIYDLDMIQSSTYLSPASQS